MERLGTSSPGGQESKTGQLKKKQKRKRQSNMERLGPGSPAGQENKTGQLMSKQKALN